MTLDVGLVATIFQNVRGHIIGLSVDPSERHHQLKQLISQVGGMFTTSEFIYLIPLFTLTLLSKKYINPKSHQAGVEALFCELRDLYLFQSIMSHAILQNVR